MRAPIRWLAVLRAIAAGVLGYAVIVALTTLGFVHWLGDADLYRGGWALQAKGTLVAVVAGLAGGALAAVIGGRRPLLHAAAVLPFLVIDTAYVLFVFPRSPDLVRARRQSHPHGGHGRRGMGSRYDTSSRRALRGRWAWTSRRSRSTPEDSRGAHGGGSAGEPFLQTWAGGALNSFRSPP